MNDPKNTNSEETAIKSIFEQFELMIQNGAVTGRDGVITIPSGLIRDAWEITVVWSF